jgi:hypothetical protein
MNLAQWYDNTGNTPARISDFEVVFTNIVRNILGLAGIVLFLLLLVGGFKFMTAGGDPKALDAAKKTITYAIAGMVLVASAFLILRFIQVFTGIDVTNFRVTP